MTAAKLLMQLQRFEVSKPIEGWFVYARPSRLTRTRLRRCEIPSHEDPYGVNICPEDQIRVRCIASGLRPAAAVLRRKRTQTDEQPATSLEQM